MALLCQNKWDMPGRYSTVWCDLSTEWFTPRMSTPKEELAAIVRELQETLYRLQESKNREVRLTLLRRMGLLLREADRVVDE